MNTIIEEIKDINETHWGNGVYQWIFYAGILLILICEKRKNVRTVFGLFPIVYLLAIFNPFSFRAIQLFFHGSKAYYSRMFSFMPLIFVWR